MSISGKKWCISIILFIVVMLLIIGIMTVIIDPYFHFHPPLDSLQYPIDNERYQNDGIIRHFSYDAIITGTSMTQNFKTSECDALFGVQSVKTSFAGTSPMEVTAHLYRALDANPNIRVIMRGYDALALFEDKDVIFEFNRIPTYLYDHNPLNDVSYLWNKTTFLEDTLGVLEYTRQGGITTSFDDYSTWASWARYGEEEVRSTYIRGPKSEVIRPLSEEETSMLISSTQVNAVQMAIDNPQIQFYYYFTPGSILFFDELNQEGRLQRQFDAYRLVTGLMLQVDNIHVFCIYDDYDTITNLDNYRDVMHHTPEINSMVLHCMASGEHELTLDNYNAYWDTVEAYYLTYDYESLFCD